MITNADIARQVRDAIDGSDGTGSIDQDGVVREIIDTHGLVDIDTFDSDDFWTIVARHDSTQR